MDLKNTTLFTAIILIIIPLHAFSQSQPPVFKQIICQMQVSKKTTLDISLEMADTKQKRRHGLMNRDSLKPNSGMLFIWPDEHIRNFWMKNTYFNLDLFFLDKEGTIIEIFKNAKAQDEQIITSTKKAQYVLEMKANEHNFAIGDVLKCDLNRLG